MAATPHSRIPSSDDIPEQSFSFLCLNLWFGGKLWDELIPFLKATSPDILAAQEVYDGGDVALPDHYRTVEQFQKLLGYPYVFFAPAYREAPLSGNVECGNAIFSRFPITETKTVFYDVPYNPDRDATKEAPDYSYTPRNLQHATIDIGTDRTFHIFNTHGIWGFDPDDNPRRLAMADTILEEIGSHKNVFLCGDFNVGETSKTIQKIEERLRNVFKGMLTMSFNMKQKTPSATFTPGVIDMVFASRDLMILDRQTPDVNVSDHRPLLCRVALP